MKVNLGSGKDYRDGYINIDISERWKPDLVVDVSKCVPLYNVEEIIANDVLEHIPDLVAAMANCLEMLKVGGVMRISVPYHLSLGAWQDPTHVRAFNENSWLYYTDWFWYLGWKNYRFVREDLQFVTSVHGQSLIENMPLDQILRTPGAIDSMLVVLKKIELTEEDRKTLEVYNGVHR